jgi:hypothetical protein
MRDFYPRPEVPPEAFQFAGAANGGHFVRSGPRRPFSDAEEMELALKLLHVASEAELGQFFSDLFKKAWRGVGPVGSKVIGPLRALLRTVAAKTLPSIAAAVGRSFGGPADDVIAGKLGSLVSQALAAEVAGMAAKDRVLEKYRQFVRMAGKAATAAASAPMGANPVAVAQKVLADLAKEKVTRKAASAGRSKKGLEGFPAAAVRNFAITERHATPKRPRGIEATGGNSCSICEQPPESCHCGKIGQRGRWFRSGHSIIVNC